MVFNALKKIHFNFHTIVCDLDGTLLNAESQISELNRSTIQKAMDKGVQFMIATGRRYFSALPYISQFKGNIQVIANNGQILKESPGDLRIQESYLPASTVLHVWKMLTLRNLTPLLHVDLFEEGIDLVFEKNSIHHKRYFGYERAKYIDSLYEIPTERATVLCCYEDNMNILLNLQSDLEQYALETGLRIIVTRIQNVGPCLEILPKNVSKWTGVQKFLSLNKTNPEGVISFGDEKNDLELIQQSGLGVAMLNAVPELKKIAGFISKYSNTEDGVAKTLKELL